MIQLVMVQGGTSGRLVRLGYHVPGTGRLYTVGGQVWPWPPKAPSPPPVTTSTFAPASKRRAIVYADLPTANRYHEDCTYCGSMCTGRVNRETDQGVKSVIVCDSCDTVMKPYSS